MQTEREPAGRMVQSQWTDGRLLSPLMLSRAQHPPPTPIHTFLCMQFHCYKSPRCLRRLANASAPSAAAPSLEHTKSSPDIVDRALVDRLYRRYYRQDATTTMFVSITANRASNSTNQLHRIPRYTLHKLTYSGFLGSTP